MEDHLKLFLTKMMFQEFLLDKADTERRARRLMQSASAATAVTDKRWRGSKKSIDGKAQLKKVKSVKEVTES